MIVNDRHMKMSLILYAKKESYGRQGTSTDNHEKAVINSISQEKELHPNDVRQVIQAFLDKMTDYLSSGDRLEFRDFGVFEVVKRKQKIGRNPKNAGVPILIPARNAVKFTPGKKMRKAIESELETEENTVILQAARR